MDPPQQAGPLTALLMRLLSDDPTLRPTASEARDGLADVAEGRPRGRHPVDRDGRARHEPGRRRGCGPHGRRRPAPRADGHRRGTASGAAPPVRPADRGAGGGDDGTAADRRRPLLIALAAVLVVGLGVLAAVLTRGAGADSASPTPTAAATATAAPAPVAPPVVTTTSAAPATTTAPPTSSAEPTTTTSETDDRVPTRRPSPTPWGSSRATTACCPATRTPRGRCSAPTAQSQSGGRDAFDSFWSGQSRVWAENLRVVGGNTVTATIVFTDNNGSVSASPTGSSSGRRTAGRSSSRSASGADPQRRRLRRSARPRPAGAR